MQGMYATATMLFAYGMLRERLPRSFYLLLTTMILGLVLLTTKGFLQLPNTGDWILFLTIPIIGFCNVYAKKTMKKLSFLTLTFGRYLFGALFLLLILPFLGIDHLSTIRNGVLWVVLSGILGAIRILTFYKGMELEGPTLAATMLSIAPAITAVSEYFFLGQTFTPLQLIGLALVVGAAILLSRIKAIYN